MVQATWPGGEEGVKVRSSVSSVVGVCRSRWKWFGDGKTMGDPEGAGIALGAVLWGTRRLHKVILVKGRLAAGRRQPCSLVHFAASSQHQSTLHLPTYIIHTCTTRVLPTWLGDSTQSMTLTGTRTPAYMNLSDRATTSSPGRR